MNTIVEHINSAGLSFVEFAVPMLVQSGVLIVILLLADLLLRKKVKAVFRYWIWMLVLIKLVLPASLSSPLSLGYLFGDKLTYQNLSEATSSPQPNEGVSDGINSIYIQPKPYISPVMPGLSDVKPAAAEPAGLPMVPVTPLSLQGIVFLVWLSVVIAMGLLLLQRALFVRGLVAQAEQAPRMMADALEYCRASMKVKFRVGLKVSPNATTPSVCGLIRPVILVPWNLASTLGASRLRTVLMHELAHIKRADLWVNLAQTILQIIYFYNPLLWFANCMIRRIREQAVDEAVLVAMGGKAQQYPQTLLEVAKMAFKRPALSLRLIGVVESESALAGRIKHILGRPMPKSARLGLISMLAIIIAGVVLLPMAKAQRQADPETNSQAASLDHFVGKYAIAKHPETAAFEITKKGDVFIFSDLGGSKFEMDILLQGLKGRSFEMEKGRDSLTFGDNPRSRFRVRYEPSGSRYILDAFGMRGEVQDAVISPVTDLMKISAKKQRDSDVPGTADDLKYSSVSGTVKIPGMDTPASGVVVRTISKWFDTVQTRTDERGGYTLTGIRPDAVFHISAEDEQKELFMTEMPAVVLKPGEAKTGVDLTLYPGRKASISGKVVGRRVFYQNPESLGRNVLPEHFERREDTPLAGVKIVLKNDKDVVIGQTITDQTGRYRFEGLRADGYIILVEQPAGAVAETSRTLPMAGTAPSAQPDSGQSRWVKVESEPKTDVDFHFRLDWVSLEGRVTNADGKPVSGAEVVAELCGAVMDGGEGRSGAYSKVKISYGSVTTITDNNGRYRLDGLCPVTFADGTHYLVHAKLYRRYEVCVKAEGFSPAGILVPPLTQHLVGETSRLMEDHKEMFRKQGSLFADVNLPQSRGNTITGIDFVMEKAAVIAGRVFDSEGNVVPGPRPNAWIRLINLDSGDGKEESLLVQMPDRTGFDWIALDEEGRFRINIVPPGNYIFEVARPQDRRQRATNEPITVGAGQVITGIEVIVPSDNAVVPVEVAKETVRDKPDEVLAIDELLQRWFDACLAGDLESMRRAYSPDYQLVGRDMEEMNELLGMNPDWQFSLLSVMWDQGEAMAVSGALKQGDPKVGEPMILVWGLKKSDGVWVIADIDLEEMEGLQIENSRFMQDHPDAQVWFDNPDLNAPKMRQKTDAQVEGEEIWGEAVEGVRVRLWVEKRIWRVDEEVILKSDVRNQGKRDLMLDERTGCFDVYVGARRYSRDRNTIVLVWPAPFGPGQHYNGRPIGLRRYPGLELAPGKHTIRVVLKARQNTTLGPGRLLGDLRWDATEGDWVLKENYQPPVVVSSNPVEIEILPPEEKTDVPVEVEQGGGASESKTTEPTVQETDKNRGRIIGVVLNSVTGEPIAGAYVGVGDFGDSGGSNYSRHVSEGFHDKTKTDENGRFELKGLAFTDDHPYLKYHPLVVTHPDFVRHDEKIELLKDKPAPDFKVSLRPAAKIDVRIVDDRSNPLEGLWLIRLEALDGRRFIPPGSDPHLSSFASSIWERSPDTRADKGLSNGFTFTELDTGRYSIEAIRFYLVDKPTAQNVWKPAITYHGSIPSLKIEAGQTKEVKLAPQDHQTKLTITPPDFPDVLMDELKVSSRMPLICIISRSPGAMLWNDGKIYHLEDERLGRIDKKRFIRCLFPQGSPLTINNLPPGSYSFFAVAIYGQVAGCLVGTRAELEKGDDITVDIPWRQPKGPSRVGPSHYFDNPVKLEARDYSVSQLCEILTEITQANPRITADKSIENEKIRFGKGEMSVWDILEKLYLDKGWKVDEGGDKTLTIRPAAR